MLRLATSIEGFMAHDAGHVDALVAAESSIQGFLKRYGRDRYSITTIPGESETYALGISKKYPELFKEIEQTIEEFRKDGTLKAIKQKWNLND